MIESISRGGEGMEGRREGGREGNSQREREVFCDTTKNRIRFPEKLRAKEILLLLLLLFLSPPLSQLEAQSYPLLKHGYTSYLVFAARETCSNRYESLATIWNPWSVEVVVPPFPGDGQIVPRTEIECRTSF